MFTLFRCFTEACETYEGNPIPELLYVQSERPGQEGEGGCPWPPVSLGVEAPHVMCAPRLVHVCVCVCACRLACQSTQT